MKQFVGTPINGSEEPNREPRRGASLFGGVHKKVVKASLVEVSGEAGGSTNEGGSTPKHTLPMSLSRSAGDPRNNLECWGGSPSEIGGSPITPTKGRSLMGTKAPLGSDLYEERQRNLAAALAAYEEAPSASSWQRVRVAYDRALGVLTDEDKATLWANVKTAQQARRATGATADCLVFDRYQRLRRANWDKTPNGRASRAKKDKARAANPERQAKLREYRRRAEAKLRAEKAEHAALLALAGGEP